MNENHWSCCRLLFLLTGIGCTALPEPPEEIAYGRTKLTGTATVVSLTFDDTCADQFVARPMLTKHGMKATFYVNSPRIGMNADWLSVSQLETLAADGHEVGGHTLDHADLESWPDDVVRREVCNDRAALMDLGFAPRSFAYPFGSPKQSEPVAQQVEAIVRDCGYNSARGTGELRVGSLCPSCPIAERVPPENIYHIRGGQSIHRTATLESLIERVTQAEDQGGGWVPLVFHHVCDGCNQYAVAPQLLSDFLDWLEPRSDTGTVVRSVGEVIGGELKPAVLATPAPPSAPGTNLIYNPSLEFDKDLDGVPDCWQPGGVGTNTAQFTMSSDAVDGRFAELITVTSLVSGARRLVTRQDQGLCSPIGYPGHAYGVSAFYRSTSPARFIAYYCNKANEWSVYAQSVWLSPQAEFTRAEWTVPALPVDAARISVGMSVFSTGILSLDAFSLVDSDRSPPTLQFAAPSGDTRRSGTILLAARAADDGGIYSVRFSVNGKEIQGAAMRHGDLYSVEWNSSEFPNGEVQLTALATDLAGNTATAEERFLVDANYLGHDSLPVPWSACNGAACTSKWSASAVTLELGSLTDSNSSSCSLRYSLSGRDPILEGTHYAGPIRLAASAELRAVAVSCQGMPSAMLSQALRIDTTAPSEVWILTPANDAVVFGTTPIAVNPTDNIALVRFYLDDVQLGTRKAAPWKWNWSVSTAAPGIHRIHVTAEDRAGNVTASEPISVRVP